MFDLTSSKLMILAIVALLVVGPKDLPALLRTVGRYMGIIRRHAAEFRSQFDEAIREAELDHLKNEFDALGRDLHASVEEGARVPYDAEMPQPGLPKAEPSVEPSAGEGGEAAAPASTPVAAEASQPGGTEAGTKP
jgi:sec-independent protein translocase protein TatB